MGLVAGCSVGEGFPLVLSVSENRCIPGWTVGTQEVMLFGMISLVEHLEAELEIA